MDSGGRRWMMLAMVAWAAFLTWTAGARGFFENEYITWRVMRLSQVELIHERLVAGHLPGYFVLLRAWLAAFPDTEFWMRLPSLFCVAGAAVVFRATARRWLGSGVADLSTAIFVFHQLTAWSATTARPYGMMLLAMMAAWWSLARWWESGRPIWLGALLAALVAGAAVQVLTALHTGAMALWLVFLLLRKRGKSPAIPALAISLASLAVLLAPVIVLKQKQANFDQGVNFGFPFGRTLMSLSKSWFGDWSLYYGGPTEIAKIAFLVLIAATVALAALYTRRQPSEETAFPLGSFLAFWIALPLVGLTLMQGMGGQAVLSQLRYYSGMTPAFALLTAMGLCEARHRLANRPRWQFGLAGATVALPMAASMAGMLLQDGDGLKRLLRQSAKEPVRVFATNDESAVRFEARKYGPSMIHPLTENQPEAELAALGEAQNAVWLLIYNNRKDPRDPLMNGPPAPWTATQALKVGDARMVLLEKSAAP